MLKLSGKGGGRPIRPISTSTTVLSTQSLTEVASTANAAMRYVGELRNVTNALNETLNSTMTFLDEVAANLYENLPDMKESINNLQLDIDAIKLSLNNTVQKTTAGISLPRVGGRRKRTTRGKGGRRGTRRYRK